MAEKTIKIKNISRGDFHLSLDFVMEGKTYDLKPNAVVNITMDEYNYLSTQCEGAFRKGFLKVESVAKEVEKDVDIIETKNEMSDEDIEKLMDLTLANFKKKIKDIDSLHLLKDIRTKAMEIGKQDKFMEVIDSKIGELANGSKLL